jgi:predicted O-methyltransferase YrrM
MRQSHHFGPLLQHLPYLPFSVTSRLEELLTPDSRVFEYGSGGSTLWLCDRAGQVTSVEHDVEWHTLVETQIQRSGVANCTLRLQQPARMDGAFLSQEEYGSLLMPGSFEAYVKAIDAVEDDSLDLVIVDGRARAACALQARRKLRRGGVVILDDSDRQRYADAVAELDAWPRLDFFGIKPFTVPPARTSWWTRP